MKTENIVLGCISQKVALKMWRSDILGHYTFESWMHIFEIIQEISELLEVNQKELSSFHQKKTLQTHMKT